MCLPRRASGRSARLLGLQKREEPSSKVRRVPQEEVHDADQDGDQGAGKCNHERAASAPAPGPALGPARGCHFGQTETADRAAGAGEQGAGEERERERGRGPRGLRACWRVKSFDCLTPICVVQCEGSCGVHAVGGGGGPARSADCCVWPSA